MLRRAVIIYKNPLRDQLRMLRVVQRLMAGDFTGGDYYSSDFKLSNVSN